MNKFLSTTAAILGLATIANATPFRDIEARVCPVPQQIQVTDADCLPLADGLSVEVTTPLDAATVQKVICATFALYWNCKPTVTVTAGATDIAKDGYRLDTTGAVCKIAAADRIGILNAMRSMRQLSESERGQATSMRHVIPHVKINDYPASQFRGMHWYITDKQDPVILERVIRLAAYFKFNYLCLETCRIPFESHPEYHFEYEMPLDKKEVARLVKLGKELGVTLLPHLQIFGHAGGGGVEKGKHILLDTHPEYATLFEPDGWTWCLSNPHTVKYIEDLVTELADLYDNPPFFALGCDEAFNAGCCSLCRKTEYWKLVANHITHFHDFLAKRGIRTIIWHDMLFDHTTPAWAGSTANGDKNSEQFRAALPKSIVVAYWEYRFAKHPYRAPENGVEGFPIVDILRKDGFDVLNCGWIYDTSPELGRKATATGCLGIFQTTWGSVKNSLDYHTCFMSGATSGWNPPADYPQHIDHHIDTVNYFNRYFREINHDMKITAPKYFSTRP